MSTSTALASLSSLPLGSSSKHDPALKPNPHPYLYMPSPGTSSRSPTKHAHEYRGHRYSTSLTGELPSHIPSPLPFPKHGQCIESEGDPLLSRLRTDTLPTYLADNDNTLSTEPIQDLPLNPKPWTPSQLSVYLTRALRVRSGERPAERVARDIASWVRRGGRQWTHLLALDRRESRKPRRQHALAQRTPRRRA
ncbi:hypothetical protein BJV74DRAFT_145 [Russula compacta]|nr:hypothetical protein BJV74DRAFT_145 [Russula compacta]